MNRERARRWVEGLSAHGREVFVDVVGVGGLALLAFGARQIYRPAGWLVLGAGMLSFAVWAGMRGR